MVLFSTRHIFPPCFPLPFSAMFSTRFYFPLGIWFSTTRFVFYYDQPETVRIQYSLFLGPWLNDIFKLVVLHG